MIFLSICNYFLFFFLRFKEHRTSVYDVNIILGYEFVHLYRIELRWKKVFFENFRKRLNRGMLF